MRRDDKGGGRYGGFALLSWRIDCLASEIGFSNCTKITGWLQLLLAIWSDLMIIWTIEKNTHRQFQESELMCSNALFFLLLLTVQHWSNWLLYKTKKSRKPSRFGHVARRHNKCVCPCVWTGKDHTSVYTRGNPFSLGPMFEFTGRARLHPRQHEQHPGENRGQQTCFHCQQTGGAAKASYRIISTRHTGDLKTSKVHPIWLKLVWWFNIALPQSLSPGL